jgi:hypothetical protein
MLRTASESAPLLPGNEPKCSTFNGNTASGVQHLSAQETQKKAGISAEPRNVLDRPKRYIDAGEVARLLGVPRSVVVDDVRKGFTDSLCLNGEISGGICVVEVNDLDEPRWSAIKARLAPTVIKSAVQS